MFLHIVCSSGQITLEDNVSSHRSSVLQIWKTITQSETKSFMILSEGTTVHLFELGRYYRFWGRDRLTLFFGGKTRNFCSRAKQQKTLLKKWVWVVQQNRWR